MRAFCQTIWGTTAWGKARDQRAEVTAKKGTRNWKTNGKMDPATRRPVIEVLDKSANVIQELFDDLADMGQKTTETTMRLAKEATDKTVNSLTSDLDLSKLTRLAAGLVFAEVVLTFRSHMDKAAMDAAVAAYHEAFSDAAGKLAMLEFELDEALLSVPTVQAERARAQGFGARSLNEFKKEHSWQLPESQFPHKYSVDLAAMKGVGGAHALDKHVGKTDEQLLQRLRDEQKQSGKYGIPGASTYADIDRRYGELDQVISAYAGMPADDEPGKQSEALHAYLRYTWHTRPWALASAEQQIREYARNPPGRLRLSLGEFYPVPDVGLPESAIQDWLFAIADHLKRSIEQGEVPATSTPRTHWEWHARFPELGQLIGGWFSQDMPDEFPDHDAAVDDYTATTGPQLVARLMGELYELLALALQESDYALALAELGMEVDPPKPYSPSGWLAHLAGGLGGFKADYGPGPAAS